MGVCKKALLLVGFIFILSVSGYRGYAEEPSREAQIEDLERRVESLENSIWAIIRRFRGDYYTPDLYECVVERTNIAKRDREDFQGYFIDVVKMIQDEIKEFQDKVLTVK